MNPHPLSAFQNYRNRQFQTESPLITNNTKRLHPPTFWSGPQPLHNASRTPPSRLGKVDLLHGVTCYDPWMSFSASIDSTLGQTHIRTHTHLLRMVIANCEVECILRAKNSSVTWNDWTWCLSETSCSFWMLAEMAQIAKTVQTRIQKGHDGIRHGGSWVSHFPFEKIIARYVGVISPDITWVIRPPSSLGSGWNEIHCPPANCCEITFKQVKNSNRNQESFTSVQMVHTHTRPAAARLFRKMHLGVGRLCFHKKSKCAEKCKTSEIRSDVSMCCHQQGHREFPDSLHGFEPKYLTQWPNEHSDSTEHHGLSSHHSNRWHCPK